ncbi:alcohol dehydrogenase catalytic domain-containing protein [bacterium]|nr:alcohol dehydrogenase catalytic domain-containing protein [bacterium]
MRAAVLSEINIPMTIEDLTFGEPIAGEALVRVITAGVCHSDLHFIEGTYKRSLPMVLGHEVAGVVEAVGPGVTNVCQPKGQK